MAPEPPERYDDGPDVFERTVEWAVSQGIETATFHILTPYPGTTLHARMVAAGRITSDDWERYDTRHVVFRPARLTPEELEAGYWRAYWVKPNAARIFIGCFLS